MTSAVTSQRNKPVVTLKTRRVSGVVKPYGHTLAKGVALVPVSQDYLIPSADVYEEQENNDETIWIQSQNYIDDILWRPGSGPG